MLFLHACTLLADIVVFFTAQGVLSPQCMLAESLHLSANESARLSLKDPLVLASPDHIPQLIVPVLLLKRPVSTKADQVHEGGSER